MCSMSSSASTLLGLLQSPHSWGVPYLLRQLASSVCGVASHPLLREPLVEPPRADPLYCRQVAYPRASAQSTHQIIERR